MENKLIKNSVILELNEKYRTIWALSHLVSLGHWDLEVYMPSEGVSSRGEALGKVETLIQKLILDKKFISLLKKAISEKNLNDYEKGIIRVLKRSVKFYKKLPPDFIEEFSKITTEAHLAWKNAREKSDFNLFEPYLTKIVELSRKKAEYLGYKKHPYDALLDEFEEGLTTKEVEKYFNLIKKPLIGLLSYIKNSPKYEEEHDLEKIEYDIEKMKKLNEKFFEHFHFYKNHLRIDVSAHPFTINLGKGDTRITTRYEGKDFNKSLSSTIHEYGHALYEMQTHEDLNFSPISKPSSLILHESQSIFWENFIGKSKEIIILFREEINDLNPKLSGYSDEEIFIYFNLVKPSLIRVEADEISYHLHIIIRFEIERDLIEGKIEVKDLPKIWNQKYKDYLGVEVKNDKEGVLQDVHWSQGYIGYFPTYSLGSALSAIWKYNLEKELGKISELIKTKDGVKKIQNWLKENIHQHGSTYLFPDIVKKIHKEDFNHKYFIDYLNEKYKGIY